MKHVYIVSFINIINTNTFLLFVAKFVILLIITAAATVATAKNIVIMMMVIIIIKVIDIIKEEVIEW